MLSHKQMLLKVAAMWGFNPHQGPGGKGPSRNQVVGGVWHSEAPRLLPAPKVLRSLPGSTLSRPHAKAAPQRLEGSLCFPELRSYRRLSWISEPLQTLPV